jgi:hypothetical protein
MRATRTLVAAVLLTCGVALALLAWWWRPAHPEHDRPLRRLLDDPRGLRIALDRQRPPGPRREFCSEDFRQVLAPEWQAVSDPNEFLGHGRAPGGDGATPLAVDQPPAVEHDGDASWVRFPSGAGAIARLVPVEPQVDVEISFERRSGAALEPGEEAPRALWFELSQPTRGVTKLEDLKVLLASRVMVARAEVDRASARAEPGGFERVTLVTRTTRYTKGAVVVLLAGSQARSRPAPVDFARSVSARSRCATRSSPRSRRSEPRTWCATARSRASSVPPCCSPREPRPRSISP